MMPYLTDRHEDENRQVHTLAETDKTRQIVSVCCVLMKGA